LSAPKEVKGAALVDWADAHSRLQAGLETVAAAFGAGEAAIVPRDLKKVCTICGLRALCRIGTLADGAMPTDGEGYDDE